MHRTNALPVLLFICSCSPNSQSQSQPPDENDIVLLAQDDADMNAAIAKARATLDEFLALKASPQKGANGFRLKVALSDSNGTEHFWVIPFVETTNGFEGTLANDPEMITGVKAGQQIKFLKKDISDWGYVKEGRQIGSFTVCAMFKHMSADEVEYYRANHGFDC